METISRAEVNKADRELEQGLKMTDELNNMNIQKLRRVIFYLNELRPIAKKLHKLDENACNYGLTPSQEKREERLEKKGQELAKELGLKFYHQGDPRGATVYLIDKTMDGSNYTNGVVIY